MDFIGAYQWVNIRFLLEGLWITIQVSILSIIFSLLIGTLLGVIRYFDIPIVSRVVGWGIDIIRNLPLLLIIFFSYFGLPQIGISLNVFWASVMAMSIFESAMISEIVRGGIVAIPSGQTEAALATGLSRVQVMGYILLPQAFRTMLPALISQLIALIKDTNLATIIALPELMHNARIAYTQNTAWIFPMFIAITAIYWVICFALSKLSRYIGKRQLVS